MKYKKVLPVFIFFFCSINSYNAISQHQIIFCGEKIPVANNFVSETLMNAIRKQIPMLTYLNYEGALFKIFHL
jgi:hypothetical protein